MCAVGRENLNSAKFLFVLSFLFFKRHKDIFKPLQVHVEAVLCYGDKSVVKVLVSVPLAYS